MTKTEGIRLVLVSIQMVIRKSTFDSCAIVLLVTPETTNDETGCKYEKLNANRQEQHVICARRGPGRFNSACGIDSLNHQFTSDCNYNLREKWISFIICRTMSS